MSTSRGRRTRKNGCKLPAGRGAWLDGSGGIELRTLPWYEKLDLIAGMIPAPEGVPGPSGPCQTGHEWVVYSKAVREARLMLQCIECGATGTVDDPGEDERSEAVHAPSRPYRWHDATRVTERGFAAPNVIRAIDGPRCNCPSESTLAEIRGYERIPCGISEHPGGLIDIPEGELLEVAAMVEGSKLCSSLVHHFIPCYEAETGFRLSTATYTILGRIERWDSFGLHCAPAVVARIIREFAAWEPVASASG